MDTTSFVFVSITETVPGALWLPEFVTYTFFPSGMTVTPLGWAPTGTFAVMLFVDVLITETRLAIGFVKYTFFPSGVIATSRGKWEDSKFTVAVTLFVEVLIIEKEKAAEVTYIVISRPFGYPLLVVPLQEIQKKNVDL